MRTSVASLRCVCVWAACAAGLLLSGCQEADTKIVLLNNQDVIALDADDIVLLMTRAGLTEDQVLEVGTELRNGLGSVGAAQIHAGKTIEAIFVVDGPLVRGVSRTRSAFVYNVEEGEFRQ